MSNIALRGASGAVTPERQARGLIQLLLCRLDLANNHIHELGLAFQTEDAYRAITLNVRLKRALGDAELCIIVLEQLAGRTEHNARAALDYTRRRARLPQALARILISRLPDHRNPVMEYHDRIALALDSQPAHATTMLGQNTR